MTIITATKSDGTTRRCDARCYNATGLKCTCICGGMNHGKGLDKAIENDIIYLLENENLADWTFRRHPVQMRLPFSQTPLMMSR